MSRSLLFKTVRRLLVQGAHESGQSFAPRSALSRRDFLVGSAGVAVTLGLGSVGHAFAKTNKSIAIIGGGAAGLTCAYRLAAKGITPVLFDAANNLGGRIQTFRDFHEGMFCELGGELVDTKHTDLRDLGIELGVPLQRLNEAGDGREDIYFFQGAFRTARDMLDAKNGKGAFAGLAKQIAKDQKNLLNATGGWTPRAKMLDNTNLMAYLDRYGAGMPVWARDLIKIAYLTEFGIDPAEQSSLNLVDLIGSSETEDFQIFGDSDEAFRIKGGSSTLIEALTSALKGRCDMRLGQGLSALRHKGDKIEVSCDIGKGQSSDLFDSVVLALPFTRLRTVQGIDTLGLASAKLNAIRNLGYGTNGKMMWGTKDRIWREKEAGLPVSSNGTFYSDLPFQQIWDTSRGQAGKAGILTNFFAGKTDKASREEEYVAITAALKSISPKMAESIDPTAMAAFYWATNPNTLGSYASAKVGQYTTMLDVAGTPEMNGRLLFAGEHTSKEFLGYMNGAVQSGNRVAAEALHALEV